MRTLITKTDFKDSDVIIVANNRIALTLKHQLSETNPILPHIYTWNEFLQFCWELSTNYQEKTLIDNDISYFIWTQIIKQSDIKFSNSLVDEVATHYSWFKKQNIKNMFAENTMQEYFLIWVQKYQHWKDKYSLIDSYDLPYIIDFKNFNYYSYGFKALTKQQADIFKKINITQLKIKQKTNEFDTKTFATFDDELQSCVHWAKELYDKNPKKSTAIIVPELQKYGFNFKQHFNTIFNQHLVQTKHKSFNVSLGKPLTSYNIISDLLLILELHLEAVDNKISVKNLLKICNSNYIPQFKKVVLNSLLKLEKEYISKDELTRIIAIDFIKFDKKYNYNKWLNNFNDILNLWQFNQHKKMTSDEYQVFEKYKTSSLIFNKLAIFNQKVDFKIAFWMLKVLLEKVVFSPQSGDNQIQIMGNLEAEGLEFDYSWIFGVNSTTIPPSLNKLRFIPHHLCKKYKVPRCDFEHIKIDSIASIDSFALTSKNPIVSYSKEIDNIIYIGSPLIHWNNTVLTFEFKNTKEKELEIIQDNKAQNITHYQIKKGIKTLKDQGLCQFRGFANRLDIDEFDEEIIGLSSIDKGNILHKVLENIYSKITNKQELEAVENIEHFIKNHLTDAMSEYKCDEFYNVVFNDIFNKVNEFLELEKMRDNWQVLAVEKQQKIKLANLEFSTKIDRIDEVSGEKIIFDYKSGEASRSKWCGNIVEPQLPIYALSGDYQALSFVNFKDKVGYSATSENKDILGSVKHKANLCKGITTWQEQAEYWQQHLEQIATDFENGKAGVNPRKQSCLYCNLQSFCKIEQKL